MYTLRMLCEVVEYILSYKLTKKGADKYCPQKQQHFKSKIGSSIAQNYVI